MKKMKKIMAAAIAMMTFSTAAAVTGTVAWFTASNVVTATGMTLQADTEQGINISNESLAEWKDSIEASHDGTLNDDQARFIPTTTTDANIWKHGNSDDANSSTAVGGLVDLTLADAGNGIKKVNNSGSAIHDKNIYLLNKFYLRSSTPLEIAGKTLYCNSVTASGSTASTLLDMSFRVLVKYGSAVKIYAPFEANQDTDAPALRPTDKNQVLGTNVTIPASTANTAATLIEIEVYCYFDGNDSHCKSANIPTDGVFSNLSVECKFGTETIA